MKVIINRTDAIGDTILTMPMAKAIKEKYPDAKILFLISSKSKDLFINHPYIDEAIIYDRTIPFFKRLFFLLSVFKKFRPDVYFYVGGGHSPSFISFLLRTPIRGGIRSKIQSFLFLNKAIRQRRSTVEMHEVDYNLSLLKVIDIDYHYTSKSNLAPQIEISEVEIENSLLKLKSDIETDGLTFFNKLIFIHPGMVGHTLNWPTRNYVKLIQKIEENFKDQFLFIISYTPADSRYIDEFRDELIRDDYQSIHKCVYFLDGSKRGLRYYMSLLKKATLFVGPSTGTTHIANTLKVPQLAIYSPIRVQSALRWGPFNREGNLVKVIVPDAVCGEQKKCAGPDCPYYFCMERIEVDEVFDSAKELLTKRELNESN